MSKQIAEALVECGYASQCKGAEELTSHERLHVFLHRGAVYVSTARGWVIVDPFADTLEGRRQADALEYHLFDFGNECSLWERSTAEVDFPPMGNNHQWRLDRIKWCFEQLEGVKDE